MKIKKEKLIVVTENHGGYLSGYCSVCGVRGWLDELKHKDDCPIIPNRNQLIEIKECSE